jgi:uncharacterized protein (DUF305 family)
MFRSPFAARVLALLAACILHGQALAQHQGMHDAMPQHQAAPAAARPVFVASSAKPFGALMADAMAVMDDGMARAPMNGHADHDFVTMMLPHHQGAIDMARAVLLHTQDPALRNLALGIIAEQQNEINVMQAWLKGHPQRKGATQ